MIKLLYQEPMCLVKHTSVQGYTIYCLFTHWADGVLVAPLSDPVGIYWSWFAGVLLSRVFSHKESNNMNTLTSFTSSLAIFNYIDLKWDKNHFTGIICFAYIVVSVVFSIGSGLICLLFCLIEIFLMSPLRFLFFFILFFICSHSFHFIFYYFL